MAAAAYEDSGTIRFSKMEPIHRPEWAYPLAVGEHVREFDPEGCHMVEAILGDDSRITPHPPTWRGLSVCRVPTPRDAL